MLSRKCFELVLNPGVRGYKKSLIPTLHLLGRRQKKVGVFWPQRSAMIEWDFDREVNVFCKRFKLQPRETIKDSFMTRNYVEGETKKREDLGMEAISLTSNAQLAEEGMRLLRELLTEQISECYPKLPSQGVQALQDYLCSADVLSSVASQMGLEPLVLRTGLGLEVEPPLMVDTLLAILASVENPAELCKRYILIELSGKDVFDVWHPLEVSHMLNSILQGQNLPAYEPRLIADAGRNTLEAVFYVAVYSDKKFLGKGAGETQAAAIDMAVRDALKRQFGVTRAMRSPFEIAVMKSFRERNAGLTA